MARASRVGLLTALLALPLCTACLDDYGEYDFVPDAGTPGASAAGGAGSGAPSNVGAGGAGNVGPGNASAPTGGTGNVVAGNTGDGSGVAGSGGSPTSGEPADGVAGGAPVAPVDVTTTAPTGAPMPAFEPGSP